jgi:hypothetical protein
MTLLVEEPWPWFVLAGVGQMLCVALVAAGQRRAAVWASVAIFAVGGDPA